MPVWLSAGVRVLVAAEAGDMDAVAALLAVLDDAELETLRRTVSLIEHPITIEWADRRYAKDVGE